MSFIRGKIESPRELQPKTITSGELLAQECSCGCGRWFDNVTGEELLVQTLEEIMQIDKPLCGPDAETAHSQKVPQSVAFSGGTDDKG